MKELPNDRLTVKETWTEGILLGTLTKEQKAKYKQMSISEKRKIIDDYKNKRPIEIEGVSEEGNSDDNFDTLKLQRTLDKRNLNSLSQNAIHSLDKNGVGQFIDSFTSKLSSTLFNPSNSDQMFTYELINQNFVLIKLLDDNNKQNDKIIKQNEEIINLLTQIANK
ncbi:hypothetical protein [Staphylococcus hominis]|uniref:hypothetical protein n=1 Tax=Staphylococcus hominis TaxID=1290 RepID=UPI0028793FA8|nr:hypothetical protein [Staphylococcus hominis]MDS3898503.1 hypothetical protein [Staphylococcus hominis]